MSRAKYIISWISWPLLMIVCIAITQVGFEQDSVLFYFNFAYFLLAVSLYFLERFMPHEESWRRPDGQTIASLLHTISSKGTVQGLLLFGGVIGLAEIMTPVSEAGPEYGIWPREWPMVAQVMLGLIAAEFGLYWVHRAGHELPFFWRFHAIHHSVTKLWFVNTGRFHFIDSLLSIILGLGIILAMGAPMEVVMWLSAITAFIGMLTHCNVEMRFGPISWVFNTPELHRWHHSMDLSEGNRNYCENVMIWDHVFRTFVNPRRRPPAVIGMSDYLPERFIHQLIWPFLTVKAKQRIIPEFVPKPFGYEDKTSS